MSESREATISKFAKSFQISFESANPCSGREDNSFGFLRKYPQTKEPRLAFLRSVSVIPTPATRPYVSRATGARAKTGKKSVWASCQYALRAYHTFSVLELHFAKENWTRIMTVQWHTYLVKHSHSERPSWLDSFETMRKFDYRSQFRHHLSI